MSDTNKPTLENKPSDSAMYVAFCRALSTYDPREEIRGHDALAEIFLPDHFIQALKAPGGPESLRKRFDAGIPGTYEFFTARTAYLDAIVQQALQENIPQLVFLGAGYDSRPYRMRGSIQETWIYELDIESTQLEKQSILQKHKVPIPPQLHYVSINFNTDSIEDVLQKTGYDPDQETLFIWEGVTYYLPKETIDATLQTIRKISSSGSTVCFEYMIDAPDITQRYGVKEALESMRVRYPNEPVMFKIPEGGIPSFLAERGYTLLEHLSPEDMEKRFLTLRDGSLSGKALALFGFVHASI